jgi:hypothetical protein
MVHYMPGVATTRLISSMRLAQDTINNVRVLRTKYFIGLT